VLADKGFCSAFVSKTGDHGRAGVDHGRAGVEVAELASRRQSWCRATSSSACMMITLALYTVLRTV